MTPRPVLATLAIVAAGLAAACVPAPTPAPPTTTAKPAPPTTAKPATTTTTTTSTTVAPPPPDLRQVTYSAAVDDMAAACETHLPKSVSTLTEFEATLLNLFELPRTSSERDDTNAARVARTAALTTYEADSVDIIEAISAWNTLAANAAYSEYVEAAHFDVATEFDAARTDFHSAIVDSSNIYSDWRLSGDTAMADSLTTALAAFDDAVERAADRFDGLDQACAALEAPPAA